MNDFLKMAYDVGVQQALNEAGLSPREKVALGPGGWRGLMEGSHAILPGMVGAGAGAIAADEGQGWKGFLQGGAMGAGLGLGARAAHSMTGNGKTVTNVMRGITGKEITDAADLTAEGIQGALRANRNVNLGAAAGAGVAGAALAPENKPEPQGFLGRFR
jgi:hypothetical protein